MVTGAVKLLLRTAEHSRCTFLKRQVLGGVWNRTMSQGTVMTETVDSVNAESDISSEPKERKPLWFSSYLAAAHVKLMEGSTPQCARVLHPGPALEMIDLYGHPSLISLLKIASVSRMLAMQTPVDTSGQTFFDYSKLTDGFFTFFHTTCATIAKSMYDPEFSKWPLEVEVRPGHIGRTSLSTVSTMLSPTHREVGELFQQTVQVVLVDKTTRRPCPVSDYWRQLYLPHCVRGDQGLVIARQHPPPGGPASVYQVTVAWSDTDNYNHTNFASYPRFALDAVHNALSKGHLADCLSEDDVGAGVREVRVAYIGEAVQGDVLTVRVWCVPEQDRTVVCSMEKDGQIVNQVTLAFHAPDPPSQL